MSSNVYKRAVEDAIAKHGRGVFLKLTGTSYGLTFDEREQLIRQELREPLFGTPRCTRKRAWDVDTRLEQLKEYARDFDLEEATKQWDTLHEYCKEHGDIKF